MSAGTVIRFDEVKGYGFVSPDAGGDDVFIHVNDLLFDKRELSVGARVEFSLEDGERGPKANGVRLLDRPGPTPPLRVSSGSVDDDDTCDVLSARDFTSEITEILVRGVPTVTAGQIAQIRAQMLQMARAHRWVDED